MLAQLTNLTALDLSGKKVTAAMLTVAAKQPFASRLTSFSYYRRLTNNNSRPPRRPAAPPPCRLHPPTHRPLTQAWRLCCQGKRRAAAVAQGLATRRASSRVRVS